MSTMNWPPAGWAFDLDDGGAPPVQTEAPKSFDSVSDGVAELQRRAAERREARRADKAEREERVAEDRQKAAKYMAEKESELDAEEAGEKDDEDEEPRRKEKKADKEEKAEKKSREEEPEEDDSGEDPEGDDDVSPDDDEEADDSENDDEADEAEKVESKLKVGDTEVEIPKGTPKAAVEAIKALQHRLTSDYTKKTQEVAQGKNAVAQRAQALEMHAQQLTRAQDAVLAMAQQMIGQPPPLEMAQTDIQGYTIQKALYEQRLAQLQGLGANAQGLKQQQQQLQQQQQQERLAEEARQMIRVLPELAEPKARQDFMAKAVRVAEASGFTQQDVSAVGDHRMLHLLNRLIKAEAQLSAMNKAGKSVKSKLANVPPKVARGGNASPDNGKGASIQRAKQEFFNSKRSLADVRRYLDRSN